MRAQGIKQDFPRATLYNCHPVFPFLLLSMKHKGRETKFLRSGSGMFGEDQILEYAQREFPRRKISVYGGGKIDYLSEEGEVLRVYGASSRFGSVDLQEVARLIREQFKTRYTVNVEQLVA